MTVNDKKVMTVVLLIISILLLPATVIADAEDDPVLTKVMIDQLETRDVGGDNEFVWDIQGWVGKDLTKFWIKSEGERSSGETEEAEVQFLYSRALSTYWDLQAGIRHDFEPSPSRDWLAIGFMGLAPYFFEIDTALFIGESGRTALRFEAEYELLFTQRVILTPEIEVNFFGQDDVAVGVGSGLSDVEAGLRLRYEFRREFAPYIGVNWSRLFGRTADFAGANGISKSDSQFMIGIRAWF